MKVHFKEAINLPAAQVFDAIVDHVKMSKYFISSADSSIVEGKKIMWEWAEYDASHEIHVLKVEKNKLIRFEWDPTGKPTITEIQLEENGDTKTIVSITEGEWSNDEPGGKKAMQQTQGWTNFFDCLKAYLLFNVDLRRGEKL